VLPINFLNEKLYIFLWFWMVCVLLLSALSILLWLWRLLLPGNRRAFVGRFLKLSGLLTCGDKKAVGVFAQGTLCLDGVFLAHMISDQSSEIVAGEVLSLMFLRFKRYGPAGGSNGCRPSAHNHSSGPPSARGEGCRGSGSRAAEPLQSPLEQDGIDGAADKSYFLPQTYTFS